MTAQILHVDGGFHAMGTTTPASQPLSRRVDSLTVAEVAVPIDETFVSDCRAGQPTRFSALVVASQVKPALDAVGDLVPPM
jgi:hypothetical protein